MRPAHCGVGRVPVSEDRCGRRRSLTQILAGAALAGVALAACGGDDEPDALRPAVDQIAPAIEAVETELGGPQRYFEINATPQFVNVFVAVEDGTQVETYLFADGDLQPPTPPQGAHGKTFEAVAALTFDPDRVLEGVTEELPDSDIVNFSIIGGPGGAVQFGALVESASGGTLDLVLAPDGSIQTLATD